MKYLPIKLLAVLGLGLTLSCVEDDDLNPEIVIPTTELPENSVAFLTTYFSAETVTTASKKTSPDPDDDGYYEVRLSNGVEIEYNQEGDWVEIDSNNGQIPDGILPVSMTDYISQNHPNQVIDNVDRERFGNTGYTGYEVELEPSEIELYFDAEGMYIGQHKPDYYDVDSHDDKMSITYGQLPASSQLILADLGITESANPKVYQSTDNDLEDYYEVKTAEGISIEFNKEGSWTSIEAETTPLTISYFEGVLPESITSHFSTNYPNEKIEEVEITGTIITIETTTDKDIKYRTDGTFIGVS